MRSSPLEYAANVSSCWDVVAEFVSVRVSVGVTVDAASVDFVPPKTFFWYEMPEFDGLVPSKTF